MGFLERLRQQKEARERESQRQAQIARSPFEQELKLERQAETFHHDQRRRAEQMLKESGIKPLLDELGNLVGGGGVFLYYGQSDTIQSRELEKRRILIRDVDSYLAIFAWDYQKNKVGIGGYYNCSEKYFVIEVCPDGIVKIDAASSRGSTINSNQWRSNSSFLEDALERAFNNPRVHKWRREKETFTDPGGRGPCLPGNSLISTPNGFALIKNLRVGDFVWTIDAYGYKVKAPIIQKTKRPVAENHKMAHVILKDSRELVASLGHPTIDYRDIGSLVKGDDLDMSSVVLIKVISYRGKYTYDILPYGDTGGYWANNILIGSTLCDQFEKMENQNFPYDLMWF